MVRHNFLPAFISLEAIDSDRVDELELFDPGSFCFEDLGHMSERIDECSALSLIWRDYANIGSRKVSSEQTFKTTERDINKRWVISRCPTTSIETAPDIHDNIGAIVQAMLYFHKGLKFHGILPRVHLCAWGILDTVVV